VHEFFTFIDHSPLALAIASCGSVLPLGLD
jgi:hypothetical protein